MDPGSLVLEPVLLNFTLELLIRQENIKPDFKELRLILFIHLLLFLKTSYVAALLRHCYRLKCDIPLEETNKSGKWMSAFSEWAPCMELWKHRQGLLWLADGECERASQMRRMTVQAFRNEKEWGKREEKKCRRGLTWDRMASEGTSYTFRVEWVCHVVENRARMMILLELYRI